MHQVLAVLRRYLEQGYCLHGSQSRFEIVEPRPARCTSLRSDKCQNAVYASKDCVRIPCVMALIARADLLKPSKSGYCVEDTRLIVTGENVKFKPGFVYVLPNDSFEEVGDEYISRRPVRSAAVLEVEPDILKLLPDLEININN